MEKEFLFKEAGKGKAAFCLSGWEEKVSFVENINRYVGSGKRVYVTVFEESRKLK